MFIQQQKNAVHPWVSEGNWSQEPSHIQKAADAQVPHIKWKCTINKNFNPSLLNPRMGNAGIGRADSVS